MTHSVVSGGHFTVGNEVVLRSCISLKPPDLSWYRATRRRAITVSGWHKLVTVAMATCLLIHLSSVADVAVSIEERFVTGAVVESLEATKFTANGHIAGLVLKLLTWFIDQLTID
jgi:hypothetical protein